MSAHSKGDIWYRMDDVLYAAPVDEFDNPVGPSTLRLRVVKFKVTKVTPKGVWLDGYKFALTSARKRYACPSLEEARESFIARKSRQLSILQDRVARAYLAIDMANAYKE